MRVKPFTRLVRNFSTLLSAVFISTPAFAAAPIDGLYAEIFGGYTYMPANVSAVLNGLTFSNTRYNSGYHAGGRYGYKSNPMRYEGEIGYISANPSRYSVDTRLQSSLTGQTDATTAMVNVYYDGMEVIHPLTPFIGAGIGYAYVSSRLYGTDTLLGSTEFRGTGSAFAYQGTLGVAYNFVDNYSLSIAYRYLGTTKVDQLGKIFQAQLASASVTYRFDGGYYK